LVSSQHVSIPVSRTAHESPASVSSQLSAVPIPNEPTFTITATAKSPGRAVTLVNAAVSAIQAFVNRSATQQGGAPQLLARYQAAQSLADQLELKSSTLQARLTSHLPAASRAKVTAAKLASQVASLKAQALSGAYLSLSQNGGAPALDVLSNPTVPSANNRHSNIEKYGVVGAVAGLAIGIAPAGLIGGLGSRRRARAYAA
jgi:hypothetical protein